MSLATMIGEMRGCVPNYSAGLARIHLKNAWTDIRNLKGWSFQIGNTGYSIPGMINAGAVTVALGVDTVIGNPAATAAWLAGSNAVSLITQRQFRTGQGTIYNIIAMGTDGTVSYATILTAGSGQTPGTYSLAVADLIGPGTGATVDVTVDADGTVTLPPVVTALGTDYVSPAITLAAGGTPATFSVILTAQLTLDRPWIDAYYLGPSQGYSIYQPYIVAPVAGFLAWEYFLDVRNVIALDVNNTRGIWEKVNEADPQRQIFSNPGNLIPHGTDTRGYGTVNQSATIGYPMYELYPQPQSIFVYQVGYSWAGPELTDDPATSAVPTPMTEHVVKTLARIKAYEWAEANKTADNPRGAGADFRFLMQAAQAQYKDQLHEIRSIDRDIYDAYYKQMTRFTNIGVVATFNPATGTVSSRNM